MFQFLLGMGMWLFFFSLILCRPGGTVTAGAPNWPQGTGIALISDFRSPILDPRFQVSDSRFLIPDSRFQVSDSRFLSAGFGISRHHRMSEFQHLLAPLILHPFSLLFLPPLLNFVSSTFHPFPFLLLLPTLQIMACVENKREKKLVSMWVKFSTVDHKCLELVRLPLSYAYCSNGDKPLSLVNLITWVFNVYCVCNGSGGMLVW